MVVEWRTEEEKNIGASTRDVTQSPTLIDPRYNVLRRHSRVHIVRNIPNTKSTLLLTFFFLIIEVFLKNYFKIIFFLN